LKVMRITVPPLRQRPEDIPLLVEHYLPRLAKEHGKRLSGITPEARRILSAYGWPGNVRELINCLETMVVLAQGELLDAGDLPAEIHPAPPTATPADIQPGISLEDAEQLLIERTLQATAGNRQQTAQMLGIGQRTLYRKLKQYGLTQSTGGGSAP